MSYTVLAVKWRPKRFEELVGQAHVVTALVNSLAAGRLHHAYLFSGTRGVGKTTVARILAKALNCEQGVGAEPCGQCAACTAIDEGRFVDLIEVDAASRTRVDDTRELLDNVQYMPTRGRFKVYLIDEVHMLSNHSFNALLKTLEEPPPHVKFLFATTDPQKLPVTVLSRCLQFNLKKLPIGLIQEQLARICDAESVTAEPEGLRAIARAADGSVRDGLSLLDQGIAFGGGTVTEADVKSMLGSIDRGHVVRLIEHLAAGDGGAILNEIATLDESAPDYGSVLDELMGALQRIAIVQLVGEARLDDEEPALRALAAQMSPEDVQLYYQIAVNGRRDLAYCRDDRMSIEMTLLRMLAFTLEAGQDAAEPGSQARSVVRAKQAPSPPEDRSIRETSEPTKGREAAKTAASQAASGTASERQPITAESWSAVVRDAALRGPVRSLAENCEVREASANRLELVIAQDKSNFNTDRLRARLQEALSRYAGRSIRLSITVGEPTRATPAEVRQANEDERIRKAREAIERDPTIQAVQAAFGAVLEPDSIQPPDGKTGN